jgi:hypothetical protein
MRDPLDEFRDRLRALGATADEVEDWLGDVEAGDPDISLDRIRHASDDEIRFEIEAIRGGYEDEEDLEQSGEGTVAVGADSGINPAVEAAAREALSTPETGAPTGGESPEESRDESAGQVHTTADEDAGTTADAGQMTASEVEDQTDSTGEPWTEDEAVTVPADLLDKNVPEILDWVEADPERRGPVVLELESLTDKPRKTLVEPLQERISGSSG